MSRNRTGETLINASKHSVLKSVFGCSFSPAQSTLGSNRDRCINSRSCRFIALPGQERHGDRWPARPTPVQPASSARRKRGSLTKLTKPQCQRRLSRELYVQRGRIPSILSEAFVVKSAVSLQPGGSCHESLPTMHMQWGTAIAWRPPFPATSLEGGRPT